MTDISGVAAAFIDAHRNGSRIVPPATQLSRADILAVQSAVSATLGPVVGFKVGRVASGSTILAPINAQYCVESGGTRSVRDRLGIELEVGFEVIRPLPTNALPARPQDYFRPCVVLELVDTRLADTVADLADLKFADMQLNAGLVIGAVQEEWDGSDFGELNARLSSETETVLDGMATVPGGSALSNLDLLMTLLDDHCGGLQTGHTVITGSLCGLPWFQPDANISGKIEGLGTVSVKLRHAADRASDTA